MRAEDDVLLVGRMVVAQYSLTVTRARQAAGTLATRCYLARAKRDDRALVMRKDLEGRAKPPKTRLGSRVGEQSSVSCTAPCARPTAWRPRQAAAVVGWTLKTTVECGLPAALRSGDTLVVWKLDRLGRDVRHLINTVQELTERGVGLKALSGQSAAIDTTTSAGKLVFGIFAALAEFERELIAERTKAGLAAARPSTEGWRAVQDDGGQGAFGHGGDGAARDPHWRALPRIGRYMPDPVSSCGPR